MLGNRFVTLVANVLFNVYIRDLMTCHKAIETELFRSLPLRANGFTIEPEITARLLQAASASSRCQCATGRAAATRGRSSPPRDGLLVVVSLIHYRLTPPSRPPRASRGPITVQTIARRRLQRRHRRRERSLS